jgi:hypothetical protein
MWGVTQLEDQALTIVYIDYDYLTGELTYTLQEPLVKKDVDDQKSAQQYFTMITNALTYKESVLDSNVSVITQKQKQTRYDICIATVRGRESQKLLNFGFMFSTL